MRRGRKLTAQYGSYDFCCEDYAYKGVKEAIESLTLTGTLPSDDL